jgi:hypothetical protein
MATRRRAFRLPPHPSGPSRCRRSTTASTVGELSIDTAEELLQEEVYTCFKYEVSKRDLIRHPASASEISRQVKLSAHDCNSESARINSSLVIR